MNWIITNLVSLLTLLVAGLSAVIAFYTYRKKENNFKKASARMIINDIRQIESIKEKWFEGGILFYVENGFDGNNRLRNKHLFMNDINDDDFRLIEKYFKVSMQVVKKIIRMSEIAGSHYRELDKKIWEYQLDTNTTLNIPSGFLQNFESMSEFQSEKSTITKLLGPSLPVVIGTTGYNIIYKIAFRI